MTTTGLTIPLDEATSSALDKLAKATGESRDVAAAAAIKRYVSEQLEYYAFLKAGVDSADRGELLTQEEMEAWFEARHQPLAAE